MSFQTFYAVCIAVKIFDLNIIENLIYSKYKKYQRIIKGK